MRRHALDDVAQVDERIDPDVLTGLHEREQDRRAVGRRLAPCEEPVFPSENDWLDRASAPLLSIFSRPSSVYRASAVQLPSM
jgi:hypothetical protein